MQGKKIASSGPDLRILESSQLPAFLKPTASTRLASQLAAEAKTKPPVEEDIWWSK